MRSNAKDVGGMRRVHGQVSTAGAVVYPGSADWSVTRQSAGVYIIRFLRPFAALPTGLIAVATYTPQITAVTTRSMTVSTFAGIGSGPQDAAFSFSIEGKD